MHATRGAPHLDLDCPETALPGGGPAKPLILVETLLFSRRLEPVTLVRCGKPPSALAESARSAGYRSWPLGPPVVEHLRVARVERRTIPGGEAVTRILLPAAYPGDP